MRFVYVEQIDIDFSNFTLLVQVIKVLLNRLPIIIKIESKMKC